MEPRTAAVLIDSNVALPCEVVTVPSPRTQRGDFLFFHVHYKLALRVVMTGGAFTLNINP